MIIVPQSIKQTSLFGDNTVNVYNTISIDISRLRMIVANHKEHIYHILKNIGDKQEEISKSYESNNKIIHINKKNKINGLEDYFKHFIAKEEAKLSILRTDFFEEEEFQLEQIAEHFKSYIYAYHNCFKLEPKILHNLIAEHQKGFSESDDKDLVQLLIFYLYRYCYIGQTDE